MTEARSLPIPASQRNSITRVPCVLPVDRNSNCRKSFGIETSPSNSLKYCNSNTTTSNSSPSSTLDQSNLPRNIIPSTRYLQQRRPSFNGRILKQAYDPTDINRKLVYFEACPNSHLIAGVPSLSHCSSSNSNSPSNSFNDKYRRHAKRNGYSNYSSGNPMTSPSAEIPAQRYYRRSYINKSSADPQMRSPFRPLSTSSLAYSQANNSPYMPEKRDILHRSASLSGLYQTPVGQQRKRKLDERRESNSSNVINLSQSRNYSSNLTLNVSNDPDSTAVQDKTYISTENFVFLESIQGKAEQFPFRKAASTANLKSSSSSLGLLDAETKADLLKEKYMQNARSASRNDIMPHRIDEQNSRPIESGKIYQPNNQDGCNRSKADSPISSNLKYLLQSNETQELVSNLQQFSNVMRNQQKMINSPDKEDVINEVRDFLLQQTRGLEEEVLLELDTVLDYKMNESCSGEHSPPPEEDHTKLNDQQGKIGRSSMGCFFEYDESVEPRTCTNNITPDDVSQTKCSLNEEKSIIKKNFEEFEEEKLSSEFDKSLDPFCKLISSEDSLEKLKSKKPQKLNIDFSSGRKLQERIDSSLISDGYDTENFLRRCLPYMQPSKREIILIKPKSPNNESDNSVDISDDESI